MSAENKVPAIRFKGFGGVWEDNALGEKADLLTGNPFDSKKFSKEGVFLVRGMNVKRGYLDMSERISEYWPTSHELENFLLKEDDILIQMDGALIGKSYAKVKNRNLPALLVQRVTRIRSKDINSEFTYQYIQRDFLKHISKIKTETAVPHLSLNDIRDFQVSIPGNQNEQTKIGNYFQQLDTLIAQHQQKHDKLLNLKKSLLEKIYPKQGATVPEIRFEGFSSEWEEKKLGEFVSNISDGDWIESNHIFEQGKYRIIQTGNLGVDGEYIDKENNAKYFHQKDFDEIRANEIFPGDILISRLAEPAGRTIVLPNTGFRMVTAVDVTVIRPDNRFDSIFLKTQLNTANVLRKVNENVSGTSHKRISRSNLEKTKLLIPNLDEQTKIGSLFKSLDTLINRHKTELKKFNNIKQACLEKMFV